MTRAASGNWARPDAVGRLMAHAPWLTARLERNCIYAFSAVSPRDGAMDRLVQPWVNAETESLFLAELAQRHAEGFVVKGMDQAVWHLAGEEAVPASRRVIFLRPYSPELHPAEHLWASLPEEAFTNNVFAAPQAVDRALTTDIVAIEADPTRTCSMTGFKWTTSISLVGIQCQAHGHRVDVIARHGASREQGHWMALAAALHFEELAPRFAMAGVDLAQVQHPALPRDRHPGGAPRRCFNSLEACRLSCILGSAGTCRGKYGAAPSASTINVFATSVLASPADRNQTLSSARQADSQECNGESRNTGWSPTPHLRRPRAAGRCRHSRCSS